tara:strand:+ start:193 stop:486 length:294 start_codon:yes stop_codon:yes gene_type:complete
MATLKSKKMVRGRDLKTPLATSTMDKAKGGPGDGKKKSTKKPYKGPVLIKDVKGKVIYRAKKKGEIEKMKGYEKSIKSGLLKKTQTGYRYTRDPKKN